MAHGVRRAPHPNAPLAAPDRRATCAAAAARTLLRCADIPPAAAGRAEGCKQGADAAEPDAPGPRVRKTERDPLATASRAARWSRCGTSAMHRCSRLGPTVHERPEPSPPPPPPPPPPKTHAARTRRRLPAFGRSNQSSASGRRQGGLRRGSGREPEGGPPAGTRSSCKHAPRGEGRAHGQAKGQW